MVLPNLVDAKMAEGKKKKKFMKKAFANSHGQFKEKAERAGKSTAEFAKEHEHAPGLLGKQARLAEVGMHANHGKKKQKTASDRMSKMYGTKKKEG